MQFDPIHKLILTTYTDPIGDEFIETYRQLGKAVAVTGAQCGITDFSTVMHFKISPDLVRFLAANPTNFPDPMSRCIVASSDYLYGMWRMFQMAGSATRANLHVVRTIQEAYRILGVDTPPRYQLIDSATGKIAAANSSSDTL